MRVPLICFMLGCWNSFSAPIFYYADPLGYTQQLLICRRPPYMLFWMTHFQRTCEAKLVGGLRESGIPHFELFVFPNCRLIWTTYDLLYKRWPLRRSSQQVARHLGHTTTRPSATSWGDLPGGRNLSPSASKDSIGEGRIAFTNTFPEDIAGTVIELP